MANIYKRKNTKSIIKGILFTLIVVCILASTMWFIDEIDNRNSEQSRSSIEDSIVKATVQCYALEGQYPPGLAYLEDNYGLTLDKENYVYHYRSLGVNIMPEIDVFVYNQ